MSEQREAGFDVEAADATFARYIDRIEAGDVEAAAACLAEDARFRSATTAQFEYTSRADIAEMLAAVLTAFRDVCCVTRAGEGDTRFAVFAFTIDGVEGEDAQVWRFSPEGLIREITAYVRPLPALAQIPARVAPEIARRAGKPGLARQIAASARPIAAILRSGDKSMSPKTDPASNRRA